MDFIKRKLFFITFLCVAFLCIERTQSSPKSKHKVKHLNSTNANDDKVTLSCLGFAGSMFSDMIDALLTDQTNAEDVRFYFSSKSHPKYLTVKFNETTKRIIGNFTKVYNIERPTVLLVHGFMSSGKVPWLKEMQEAFLKWGDVNVIVVDWQKGSNTWNYVSAALHTKIVGQEIARLFAYIRSTAKNIDRNDWGKIHFIGHSLGAHISAHAAYLIKNNSTNSNSTAFKHEKIHNKTVKPWIVDRITGLDPAQPCFKAADLSLKLDESDAKFIDVIHTNARHIIYLGLGLPDRLGDVDFYPNGGQVQPGCSDIDTSFWHFLTIPKKMIETAICSHGRSYFFFTESLVNAVADNCTFVGHRWDRQYKNIYPLLNEDCDEEICPELGIHSIDSFPRNQGVYFVPTSNTSPYCGLKQNDKKLIVKQLQADEKLEKNILTKLSSKLFGK